MTRINFAFFILLFLLFSCRHTSTDGVTLLQTDSTSLVLGSEQGDSNSFSIKSNINWSISASPGWFKTNISSGSGNQRIAVSVISSNAADTQQSGTIIISPIGNPTVAPLTIPIHQRATLDTARNAYGGSEDDEFFYTIPATGGGYISVGYTGSINGDVVSNHVSFDIWIVKTDAAGKILWQKTYGSSGRDYGWWITPIQSGGYVVAGQTGGHDGDVTTFHGGFWDGWVFKIDDNGNMQWQKTFGGNGDDVLYDITPSSDGNLFAVGYSESADGDLTNNYGQRDGWVIKMDPNGNKLWSKSFGTTTDEPFFQGIATADGGIIVGGHSGYAQNDVTEIIGGSDIWIVKIDANGNKVWDHSYGGTDLDIFYTMARDNSGDYLLVGDSKSNDHDALGNHGGLDCLVIKIDENGNRKWSHVYGGSELEEGYFVLPTKDQHYMIGAQSFSSDGDLASPTRGMGDAWLFELTNDGHLAWQRSFGGTDEESARSIAELEQGNFVFSGHSSSHDGEVRGAHGRWDALLKTFKIK